jgi:hypothetical protein
MQIYFTSCTNCLSNFITIKTFIALNNTLYKTKKKAASDKVYQLLAQGRWFSPGTPASSTTKTGRHDIAEIFLKVALVTKNFNSNSFKTQSAPFFVIYKAGRESTPYW